MRSLQVGPERVKTSASTCDGTHYVDSSHTVQKKKMMQHMISLPYFPPKMDGFQRCVYPNPTSHPIFNTIPSRYKHSAYNVFVQDLKVHTSTRFDSK